MRQIYFLIVFTIGILLLSACGRSNIAENDYPAESETSATARTVSMQNDALPIRTLTILSPNIYELEIRRATTLMALEAAELPEDERFYLNVDPTFYDWQDWENQLQRLQIRMMAGDSYDLIFLDRHPLWHYVQAGFFTDFYTFIDADPTVSRKDFFQEPLTALEIDGGLYALPMSFGFHYAFINASLPEYIIQRFSQYDTVTFCTLMDIYTYLMENYGHEYDHLNFFGGSPPFANDGPRRVLESYMASFIDMDNRTANLMDSRFIDFLHRHRQVFASWNPTGNVYCVFFRSVLRERINYDVFWIASSDFGPSFTLIPGQRKQDYFLHGVPIANTDDRLIISPEYATYAGTRGSVCITAGDNAWLAWEFTKHLIETFDYFSTFQNLYIYVDGVGYRELYGMRWPHQHTLTSSISRVLYANNWDSALWGRAYIPYILMDRLDMIQQEIDAGIARVSEYNEMPMVRAFPFIPEDLTAANLELFNRRVISAEVLAQRLQNSISIWLLGG